MGERGSQPFPVALTVPYSVRGCRGWGRDTRTQRGTRHRAYPRPTRGRRLSRRPGGRRRVQRVHRPDRRGGPDRGSVGPGPGGAQAVQGRGRPGGQRGRNRLPAGPPGRRRRHLGSRCPEPRPGAAGAGGPGRGATEGAAARPLQPPGPLVLRRLGAAASGARRAVRARRGRRVRGGPAPGGRPAPADERRPRHVRGVRCRGEAGRLDRLRGGPSPGDVRRPDPSPGPRRHWQLPGEPGRCPATGVVDDGARWPVWRYDGRDSRRGSRCSSSSVPSRRCSLAARSAPATSRRGSGTTPVPDC